MMVKVKVKMTGKVMVKMIPKMIAKMISKPYPNILPLDGVYTLFHHI